MGPQSTDLDRSWWIAMEEMLRIPYRAELEAHPSEDPAEVPRDEFGAPSAGIDDNGPFSEPQSGVSPTKCKARLRGSGKNVEAGPKALAHQIACGPSIWSVTDCACRKDDSMNGIDAHDSGRDVA